MASAHGLAVGDLVTLAGTTGGTYNGTFVIATVPATTTFTITSALTTGQAGTGGTVSVPAQASITARSAGTIGTIIRGATSQAANLQEWQTSAGSVLASIGFNGTNALLKVGNGTFISPNNRTIMSLSGTSSIGTVLEINNQNAGTGYAGIFLGTSSQSGQTQIRTNGATGELEFYTNNSLVTATASTGWRFNGNSLSGVPITSRGLANQTADLLQLQSSTPTTLGGRNAVAQIYSGSTTTINSGVGGATTAASGDGTTATLTMTSATNLAVGDLIVVAGVTPTGYNTTGAVVTAVSNSSTFTVSYANTTTGAQTVAGTVSTPAQASITARSNGTKGLVIRAAASQSQNLFEVQNSSGSLLASVNSSGNLVANTGLGVNNGYGSTANLAVFGSNSTTRPSQVLKQGTSQTGDALQVQNDTSVVLTAITTLGTINFASGNTSATATAGAITAPALVTGFITMQIAGTTVKVPYYSN
jgi:hypothetical protein